MNYQLCFKVNEGKTRICGLVCCDKCGAYFWRTKHQVKDRNFCSPYCAASSRRDRRLLRCSWCGAYFLQIPSRVLQSSSGLHFCGRGCKDRAQRLDGLPQIMPPHYGGGPNYRVKAYTIYPRVCQCCGYDEHSEVMIVHHIDGDHTNNHIRNLMVLCRNCHYMVHVYMGRILGA